MGKIGSRGLEEPREERTGIKRRDRGNSTQEMAFTCRQKFSRRKWESVDRTESRAGLCKMGQLFFHSVIPNHLVLIVVSVLLLNITP